MSSKNSNFENSLLPCPKSKNLLPRPTSCPSLKFILARFMTRPSFKYFVAYSDVIF